MLSSLSDFNNQLSTISDERERIDLTNDFVWNNHLSLFQECLQLSLDALKQSQKISYGKGEAFSNLGLAYIYWNEVGDYKLAIEYCDKAYKQAMSISDKVVESGCCMFYSFMNMSKGEADKALQFLNRSKDVAHQNHLTLGEAWSDYGFGIFYAERKDIVNSERYFQEGLSLFTLVDYKIGMARCLIGLASVYSLKKQFSKAIETIDQVLILCKETNYRNLESRAFNDLGNIYLQLKKFSKAEKYLNESLVIRKESGNKSVIVTTLLALCDLHLLTSNHDKALPIAIEALKDAEETNVKPKIFQSHQRLAEIYKKMNEPWKSLEHFEKFMSLKAEVIGEESNNKINQLETKFATEKSEKEAEIFRLKNVELKDAYDKLKATQQQLIQSEKMSSLGQLTGGIAHEINNPINFVSANIHPLKRNLKEMNKLMDEYEAIISNTKGKDTVENLKKKFEKDFTIEESENLLKGIEEGSKRTAEIVKGLRNFSRLDEDAMKMANINEGIESTLAILQNKLKQQNIEVIESLSDLPEIECYPGQLNQVFMNLISNAIDAMEGKGEGEGEGESERKKEVKKIFISTSNNKDRIKISIRDTGNGMSDEVKQKIFDPFFTTKDVGKGTGLGLSISYGIVEKHDGTIEVKSELGEGTEFIITLPSRNESGIK